MTRLEILNTFRQENPAVTTRVLKDTVLHSWLKEGNREICARTRCIVDQDGTTITTTEDDQYYDLTDKIDNFQDIDSYPGGGVTYKDKRIEEKTIAQLDQESPNWRSRSAGTPKAYYRRGQWLYLDRPIDSNAEDIKIYSVLRVDDFDDDDKIPFNELGYLIPYNYALVYYLQKRAKMAKGKKGEEIKALQEYEAYIKWFKKEIGGGKYTAINYIKDSSYK